ncbi:hypothetical protein ACJRO7_014467 [Eucalyptus globulus]|uniref:Retrotransposon gag domain-containing protein n=1 Tax=Eucalyptus globulus TaxID=34317 RepID=A0ABD3L1D9_EUCGL
MGQQAQNQAAATIAAAQAAVIAVVAAATKAVAIATPAEVLVGNVIVERERLMHKLVEQFLKLNPLRFTDAGDPEAATLWIQDLENSFALLMCIKEEKVVLAIHQLQGNASTWWRATRGMIFHEDVVPVWGAFIIAFNGKYFLGSARE